MGQGEEWGYTWPSNNGKKKLSSGEKLFCLVVGTIVYVPFGIWIFLGAISFFLVVIFQMPDHEQEELHNVIMTLSFVATVLTPALCVFVWKWLDYKKLKLQLDYERQIRQDERDHEIYRQTIKIPGDS